MRRVRSRDRRVTTRRAYAFRRPITTRQSRGGSPRSRDVNGSSRDRASSSKYRTSTVQSAKKHALNTEKPRITRFDRAAAKAAADRSIATIVGSSRRRRRTPRRDATRTPTHGENARTPDAHHHGRPTGSSARLYVGNIPWSTTIEDLRELFAECGGVTRVDIPTGRQGRSRGYGLVEFNSEAEAQAAVTRMDGA